MSRFKPFSEATKPFQETPTAVSPPFGLGLPCGYPVNRPHFWSGPNFCADFQDLFNPDSAKNKKLDAAPSVPRGPSYRGHLFGALTRSPRAPPIFLVCLCWLVKPTVFGVLCSKGTGRSSGLHISMIMKEEVALAKVNLCATVWASYAGFFVRLQT